MHRSRLATIVIDCPQHEFGDHIAFWSSALGRAPMALDDPRYVSLKGRVGGDGGPYVLLQALPPEERAVHLDIESDDVDAEVARLERLGAHVKARIRDHVVMVAPSGHPFCVVPVHRPDFPAQSREWDEQKG